MKKIIKHKCECHKKGDPYGLKYGCLLSCFKCGKPKKVVTEETPTYKKITVEF